MNIHSKVRERIALLHENLKSESGHTFSTMIMTITVVTIIACLGIFAYSGITRNERALNVAEETLIAYDAIYSAYSEESEELEDEEELKAILKEATERYAAAREDEDTTIRSLLENKGAITVIVNKQFHDEGTHNETKTFVGVFTTGDKEPESQFVKDTIINDNQILELN